MVVDALLLEDADALWDGAFELLAGIDSMTTLSNCKVMFGSAPAVSFPFAASPNTF